MPDIATRQRHLMESLYENEALREHLTDDAAQVLFDWLRLQIEALVRTTAAIENDEAAGKAIAPRLKALHKLARQINRWVAYPDDDPAPILATLLQHAQAMYGETWTPPDQTQQDAFLQSVSDDLAQPACLIQHVRDLLEGLPEAKGAS